MSRYFKLNALKISALVFNVLMAGANAFGQNKTITQKHPNILFIFTDDQTRFGTFLSPDHIQTPHIDQLAKSGVNFVNSYIMGGTQGAVCAPSRASMLTARSEFEMQNEGVTIPESFITLPQYLKANGYYTWMTGKWHNDRAAFQRSFTSAKHVFFSGMGQQYDFVVTDFKKDGSSYKDTVNSIHSTDFFANTTIDFLSQYQGGKPFFAYLAFKTPHDPRTVSPEFRNLYDPSKIQLPPNFIKEQPFDNGVMSIRDEKLAAYPRDSDEIKRNIADYYAMITHIDKRIGDILNTLKERGLDKNTLVIFASDNGLAIGQHGMLGKQNLYEPSVGVPLIFSGPGVSKNTTSKAFTYLSDIFPTVCAYLQLPMPDKAESIGENLLPALQNKTFKGRNSEYYIYAGLHRGLRMGNYKLIEYLVKGQRHTQLFDLSKDPWEMHDLSTAEEAKKIIPQMHSEMEAWHEKVKDNMPVFYK